MSRAASAACLVLMACAQPQEVMQAPGYFPDPAGLAIEGSPLRIDFGRSEQGVVAALTRLEGRAPHGDAVCAGGTVRAVSWRSGTTLYFRDGMFLGWSRTGGGASGLTCGA